MTLDLPTLQQGRALAERATPGPWEAQPRDCTVAKDNFEHNHYCLGWEVYPLDVPDRGMVERGWDAALIAFAGTHLRALIDEALSHRELREKLGQLAEEAKHGSEFGSQPFQQIHKTYAARIRKLLGDQ